MSAITVDGKGNVFGRVPVYTPWWCSLASEMHVVRLVAGWFHTTTAQIAKFVELIFIL